MTVIGDRVIVEPIHQRAHEHASGLVVMDQDAPEVMGRVVACKANPEWAVGDVVIFSPDAGQRLQYDGSEYLVLAADDLLGVWD